MSTTAEWIEELKGISVLELSERIKALEEEFAGTQTLIDRGRDALLGGGGRDKIDARDHRRDAEINCGGGDDRRVRLDSSDPGPRSC